MIPPATATDAPGTAAPPDDPVPPATARTWYAVWMLALISALSNIDRGILALLVQPIKRDLAITDTQVSLLIGFAFSFFYMLVGLPMSRLTDVANRKLILTAGLSIWSLATTLSAIAQNFVGLFVARGVIGAGESVKGPNSLSLIADLVPRSKLPRAMSIFSWGIAAGQAGAMIIGGLLLSLLANTPPIELPWGGLVRNWQMVFFFTGFPGLVVALIFWLTVAEPPRRGRLRTGSVPLREVVAFVWANKAIYVPMFLSLAISAIDQFGLSAWRIAFYERTYGWSPQFVGPMLGTIGLFATPIGLVLGTLLAEHLDRRGLPDAMLRSCVIAGVLSVPLIIISPLMPSPWLALGTSTLGSIIAGIASPGQNSAIQIITPNEMRGQINAIYLFTISVIGGGVGPTAVALFTDYVFADEAKLRYAMSLTALTLAPLGVFLTWLAMKPYGRAVERGLRG